MESTASARSSTMKAVRLHGRSGPQALVFEDAPMPRLEPGDALVRVHATGITPTELEWDETYQNPDGSRRIPSIPGHELSGVVEQVPEGETLLHSGNEVFGLADFPRDGAAAEYIAVQLRNLALKPESVDHVHAAAAALSGLTAWQALMVHANLAPGQKVLVHGAAGGVGVFAVQIARWRGAVVSATASARDTEFVRHLGASQVIDYKSERFENIVSDQDLVLDSIGGDTQERSWPLIRKGGAIINLREPLPAGKLAKYGVRGIFFIVEANREHLTELARLMDEGEVKSIISRVYPLAEARSAFEPSPNRAPGKIILKVRD
jgi:NADPH:quinone reductase-like Zn-dependent oxidoreductase